MEKKNRKISIVFIVHYFPPVNSSGAKRIQAISKYLAEAGHNITVITTKKSAKDGHFSEEFPPKVNVVELNFIGAISSSTYIAGKFEPMYSEKPSFIRRFKNFVMNAFGQVPDPRLGFALGFLNPFLNRKIKNILRSADIVVGSSPPWPMLLSAIICKKRFGIPCLLDYRDHFSECHEMPGGKFAKAMEKFIDRWLITQSDHVVTISQPMTSYYKRFSPNVSTILNGYDAEAIEAAKAKKNVINNEFLTIRYMGIVSPGRVPYPLMEALVRLKKQHGNLFDRMKIEFYGHAHLVADALRESYSDIKEIFNFHGPVPYEDSLRLMLESDYLLFSETSSKETLSAQGILTTKLFEYLASGRPVIGCISKDTLAGNVLIIANSKNIVSTSVEDIFDNLENPEFYIRQENFVSEYTLDFSRKSQAFQYLKIIQETIERRNDKIH